MKTILCVGDLHFPWACMKSLEAVYAFAKKNQPDIIIQLGDLFDMYSYGRFPRTHGLLTPSEEIKTGRKMAEDMWRTFSEICPFAERYQLLGNHDERPVKKLFEKAPELEPFIRFKDIFTFENVQTMPNQREELVINDTIFIHGYRSKIGDHARHNNKSTVCGHLHRGGVVFMRLGQRTIFELNAGFLADVSSIPLSYTQQRKFAQYTKGFGFIDIYGPRFICL